MLRTVRDFPRYGEVHLVPSGHLKTRVCPYLHSELRWRDSLNSIPVYVAPYLALDLREKAEQIGQSLSRPDSREIGVSRSVSEPSAHLKQRVVGVGGAEKE